MDLSIIIVSWNVREQLKNNLASLFASEGDFKFEIIVVDNASSDGSADMVAKDFPQVRLIANLDNFGFARANNQALALARGRFYLLLNPDMEVQSYTLINMLSWAEKNPQATISGCRLVNKGGLVKQIRRFPHFFDQLMIVFKVPHFFPGVLNSYLLPNFNYDKAAKVDTVRGAFFLINVASFKRLAPSKKILLDESYFVWFEEVDFCRQIYSLGGEVWYTPEATCVDNVGQSFKQLPRGQAQRYFRDSMLTYFRKWEPQWQARLLFFSWRLISLFI